MDLSNSLCILVCYLPNCKFFYLYFWFLISLTVEIDESSISIHTTQQMLSCLEISSPQTVVHCVQIQPHSSSQHMGRMLPHTFLQWSIKGPSPTFQISLWSFIKHHELNFHCPHFVTILVFPNLHQITH